MALVGGRPLQFNLKDVLSAFLEFREEVIARRSAYELARARDAAPIRRASCNTRRTCSKP